MTIPDTKPSAAARCFGRLAKAGSVLRSGTRMDPQCFLCVRRNAAIVESVTVLPWWKPGLKREWTLPDVGPDGQCTRRVLPEVVQAGGHEPLFQVEPVAP